MPLPKILATAALIAAAALAAAGCTGSHSSGQAAAAASSFTANPTASADLAQAKAGVARCITGTPLQQLATLKVLFLENATGPHAQQVTQTRATVFGCLGVPASQRTAFKNDALTAAEHGKVYTKAGAKVYLEVTMPALLARYQKASGSPAASPSPGSADIPGTSQSALSTAGASS
jgi:hypothetical protein